MHKILYSYSDSTLTISDPKGKVIFCQECSVEAANQFAFEITGKNPMIQSLLSSEDESVL